MINIVLIFHAVRNDNLGVGALTAAEVEILRTVARRTGQKLNIHIVDGESPRPVYITGPDITVRNIRVLRHPWQFFQLAKQSDLVIDIGAGDSFTDIYGRKRLLVLFLLKYMTHLAGRPLVVAPQTVGPFNKRISRLLAGWSMRRSKIVATRDQLSTDCARGLGVSTAIVEASDVALRLPYTPPEPREADGPVRVGINVSGLLMNGGYTGKNMFGLEGDYRQLIHDIASRFAAHPDGCELHFVPHVLSWEWGAVEDDMQACEELANSFPGSVLAPAFADPSEAKSYIAGLDFFMGARMHSCIAAFSSGVPVVPMAYSRKFAGLFGSLGYTYTVDCTTDTNETILNEIFTAYEKRQTMKAEMEAAYTEGRARLQRYEDALETLISEMTGS